ncbi:MAG: hypothetical protein IT431_03310 [Phycisphaerales bacterium]|nr:hypothetical protein [Phycisphaerales bacterium]
MLLLNPRSVAFAGAVWEDVSAIVIDRVGAKTVKEWSDLGPHVVLADVPEQVVTVRVVQHVARDDVGAPLPGGSGELVFHTAPAGGDTPRKRLAAQCVVTDVTHELSLKHGAVRTVRLIAVSADGAADPVTIGDADGIGQG